MILRLLAIRLVWFAIIAIFVCRTSAADKSDTKNEVQLTTEDLMEGLRIGQKYVDDLERLEADLMKNEMNVVQEGTPGYTYARFKPNSPEAVAQSRDATVQLVARQHLSEKFGISTDRINFDEVAPVDTDRVVGVNCPTDPINANFASADGSCNNLANPRFGQAGTIFQRLLTAFYQDGISVPRNGPSPRSVSLGVVVNDSLPNYRATLMTMQWGQFLDHDLTLTPTATFSGGTPINCCSASKFGNFVSPSPHPECLPIPIPPNDPIYAPSNNCMGFVRSTFGLNLDGSTPSSRQQINANTHWMDSSMIYGSSAALTESLRDRSSGHGQMKISTSPSGRPLLPTDGTSPSKFIAGDSRVTEQPLLTVMHTLFVREHNRVANKLVSLFPFNTDDWYFKQARRVVNAKWQHINYNEYLPVLIGPTLAAVADAPRGTSPPGNPAIYTEFSTAAFRLGHSQLKSYIRLLNQNGGLSDKSYFLADSFLSGTKLLSPDFIDSALRGLINTPVQQVDNAFADDVTSQLFRTPGAGNRGLDLVALNLQRGRDHGVSPYASYWQFINPANTPLGTLNPAPVLPNSFDQLAATTPPEVIDALRRTYNSILDVDLYIGGVSERPVPGGLVGPTFGTIIALQMKNLKQADRFFYDDLSQSVSFTPDQLNLIEKTTFARIICDNSDGSIVTIQPNVFLSPDEPGNRPVPCANIPTSF